MVFGPSDPLIDETQFMRKDWSTFEFGLSMAEDLPPKMPQPRGQGFIIRAYVDADHVGDSITQCL